MLPQTLTSCALLALVALPLILVAGAGDAPLPEEASGGREATITGLIDAWRVTRNGSVLFRVRPAQDDESGRTPTPRWFRVEAARDANNRPELQVLDVVLARAGAGDARGIPVTAAGEATPREDGRDASRAVLLTWIGSAGGGN